jgi:hypothetical protein
LEGGVNVEARARHEARKVIVEGVSHMLEFGTGRAQSEPTFQACHYQEHDVINQCITHVSLNVHDRGKRLTIKSYHSLILRLFKVIILPIGLKVISAS